MMIKTSRYNSNSNTASIVQFESSTSLNIVILSFFAKKLKLIGKFTKKIAWRACKHLYIY